MKRFIDWTKSAFNKKRKTNNQEDYSPSSSSSSLPSSSPSSSLTPSLVPPSSFAPSSPLCSLTPSPVPSSPLYSLTPSLVPPSSSSRIWTHHVFPSFRGEDVRRNFLSHILAEFQRRGITVFIDDEIKRGDSIAPELVRAIQESKIAVILLSRNYASSKWCLDELVEIMKCREELGQTVIAIFYRVDPSDVKKLTGDFGKILRKTCAGKTKEDIGRWKQALEKVATVAGYHLTEWIDEATMIRKIASDISDMLNSSISSSYFDGLVGMRAHFENMEPLVCLDSNDVRMIGIWGPPGIGKTTIARFIYNQISNCFQLSVFMENFKANYSSPCSDDYTAQLQLQQQLMSQITNHKDMDVSHLGVVQDRLKDKKVLVVLDGVDHLVQLDAMAKEIGWFGPGSLIIITTQDQNLLRAHNIKDIYKVKFPSPDEALQIFCMYAFRQRFPEDGFEELAKKITDLVGKLPLGLRVMGSYFRGKPKQDWTELLPGLESSLGDIQSILKLSYDALDNKNKELFLYIACFFNNYQSERVEEHLEKTFKDVRVRLRILAEKSLISFGYPGSQIEMHSLLVKLGREIVREEHIRDPGQRQFLVDKREICGVLTGDAAGSKNVIGIDYNDDVIEELEMSERAFEGMSNLQFLRLGRNHTKLPRGLNYVSRKLQLLDYSNFPMSSLPSSVNVECLVELIMPCSKLEKLWDEIKWLSNFKRINLRNSANLEKLPDLSTATNLEILNLQNCSSLMELPFSIGNATNLQKLNLHGCSNLVELPPSIGNLQKLQKLVLENCSKLEVLPTNINLESLEKLDLTNCSKLKSFPEISTNIRVLNLSETPIEEVPPSINSWPHLEELYMSKCKILKGFSHTSEIQVPPISRLPKLKPLRNFRMMDLSSCGNLKELPNFSAATNLWSLNLSGCSNLQELPSTIGNANNLEQLNLQGCSNLQKLPSTIGNATDLEQLDLCNCSNLVELPLSIGNLQKLEMLSLEGCSRLETLPTNINLKSLDELDLTDCSMLKRFPDISTNIRVLKLQGTAIEEVFLSTTSWSRLNKLYLKGCTKLVSLPQISDSVFEINAEGCSSLVELPRSIENLQKLKTLILKGCTKLEVLPTDINLRSLKELDLSNCTVLKIFPEISTNIQELKLQGTAIEEVPPSINSWSHLGVLRMSECKNLKGFSHISESITEMYLSDTKIDEVPSFSSLQKVRPLPNLRYMDLRYCGNLKELPDFSTAINLQSLDLCNCSNLQELPSTIGNAINLKRLILRGCSNLQELPSTIGNAINLQKLNLRGCSNLQELPSTIGNAINLQKLNLRGCSNLQELPSTIGNAINLKRLILSGCSNLQELPSTIGNATILEYMDLSYCSNLVGLPLSIGNLQKLGMLVLVGCTRLEALPTNINLKSLSYLDLTDCLMLKSFPEISTNLSVLNLRGTAIEEVPLSIRSWPRLEELEMSYFENLKDFPHALDIITRLELGDTEIQEVPPCVKRMSRLDWFVIKGCGKLVLLPQFPNSLSGINAEGCESLERLDCTFPSKMFRLNFAKCFKLNQEARDLIIQTQIVLSYSYPYPYPFSVLPGREVPPYFSHRATCGDSSMTIKLKDRPLPKSMRLKACIWLVYNGDDDTDWKAQASLSAMCENELCFEAEVYREHLYIFEVHTQVTSSELVYEFEVKDKYLWEIGECGLLELS